MQWTDIQDIAISLYEDFPEVDPQWIRFTDLHEKVLNLKGFEDDPKRSNERILEAIQGAWIEEFE